jgi:hypothetical protein
MKRQFNVIAVLMLVAFSFMACGPAPVEQVSDQTETSKEYQFDPEDGTYEEAQVSITAAVPYAVLKFPLGDKHKLGYNIMTKFAQGATSNDPSSMTFAVIVQLDASKPASEVVSVNLANTTVQVESQHSDSIRISLFSGQSHFEGVEIHRRVIFSETDFKVSRNFPVNQGVYIVGEEDARPSISRAFANVNINSDPSDQPQFRMNFVSRNSTSGTVRMTIKNSAYGSARPCDSASTGVPHLGWRLYNHDCNAQ